MEPMKLHGISLIVIALSLLSLLLMISKLAGLVALTWAQVSAPVWFPVLVLAAVIFMLVFAS